MTDEKDKKIKHIAIIMDGNRRWAKQRGLPTLEGHRAGYENFKKIAKRCRELEVEHLTIYAFSTENWKRSEEEVSYLMKLLEYCLEKEKDFFINNNIKLNIMGQIERLPKNLRRLAREVMEITKNNTGETLNLAISYGGRQEIVDTVKKIIEAKIAPEEMNEEVFNKYVYTAGQPDPDMIIRTSGEQRLSGFLPWQGVYSEIFFSPKMWPDFSEKDLEEAIEEFQNRQRRYGK